MTITERFQILFNFLNTSMTAPIIITTPSTTIIFPFALKLINLNIEQFLRVDIQQLI